MNYILLFLVTAFLASCNSSTKNNAATHEPTTADSTAFTCYLYARVMDSVSLRLAEKGSSITGDLVYKLHEKDKNEGTLSGFMNGDTLWADYTFMSEGTQSMRQVAFLKSGDTMIEGYGDMENQQGKMVFKTPHSLNFQSTMVLTKVDCSK